ncbi:hypothetical protein A9Q81_11800 [Gammaproteobacteria bacterium 42_54_T18]|nr:hypothetical protein A9Q81_11800 [Gammaproteobacteria bacterium 42_54_T18]
MKETDKIELPDKKFAYPVELVDDEIKSLEGRIGELEDFEDEAMELRFELECMEDHKGQSDKKTGILKAALEVLRQAPKDQEVSYNGLITDVSGFISEIEWETKE